MLLTIYDSEIREIAHDLGYWIINQSHWFSDNKYTEKQAKEEYLRWLSKINKK